MNFFKGGMQEDGAGLLRRGVLCGRVRPFLIRRLLHERIVRATLTKRRLSKFRHDSLVVCHI